MAKEKINAEKILDCFQPGIKLSSAEIKAKTQIKDPSQLLKDLVYAEFLKQDSDGKFFLGQETYTRAELNKRKKPEDYTMIINKLFVGKYLEYHLGHEIKNFMVCDDGTRFCYLNPLGERSPEAIINTQYVFHVIESTLKNEKGVFELVGVSEIDRDVSINYQDQKNLKEEAKDCPTYKGYSLYDIFDMGEKFNKAHVASFQTKNFYVPKEDWRILIKIKCDEASFEEVGNVLNIQIMSNPQHNTCYADISGKMTYTAKKNPKTDIDVLKEIITNKDKYLCQDNAIHEKNYNMIKSFGNELCYAVLSGRAQLEVSTSNQLAYFLQRDRNLLQKFFKDFLGVNDVDKDESFTIHREKEHIDLLFVSDKHVVVLENKIDSSINGVSKVPDANGKYGSQLNKYFKYVEKEYPDQKKSYFVLAPEYNGITQDKLDNYYTNGDKYKLLSYKDLYNKFKDHKYTPNGKQASAEGEALFSQFKKSIEYLTWSNAQQRERTAYVRLNQRVEEMDSLKEKQKNSSVNHGKRNVRKI